MRTYDDPVEVRRGEAEGPAGFSWRGRSWQVRDVVAHWVETGAWWSRLESGGIGDLLAEQETWRVVADPDRRALLRAAGEDPGFGVFDLTFDWTTGGWRLVRVAD